MKWELAAVAAAALVVVAVSRRLSGTPVTAQMLFLVIGVLVGPEVLGVIEAPSAGAPVRTLAEATLAVVLFADASRIDLRALRREYSVPVRLLGIGLPLTILLGTLFAGALFGGFTPADAIILAILIAPTDAALGQVVVSDARLPLRVRQGLNVESGLNDGICVPLLYIAIAAADVESSLTSGHSAITVAAEEIGYGLLSGLVAGIVTGAIVLIAGHRDLISPAWRQVAPVAGAALAYGIAVGLGGSGFIAAFTAGMCFGWLLCGDTAEIGRFNDELGDLLNGVTFVVFGALLLGPAIGDLDWQIALYALLSLTLVRMLPVALAMLGTHTRAQTAVFMGWFGPRGLASIVFALIVVQEAHLPHGTTIVLTTYITVGLSTFAHGISAAPLAGRYVGWLAAHPGTDSPTQSSSRLPYCAHAAPHGRTRSPGRPKSPRPRRPRPGGRGPRQASRADVAYVPAIIELADDEAVAPGAHAYDYRAVEHQPGLLQDLRWTCRPRARVPLAQDGVLDRSLHLGDVQYDQRLAIFVADVPAAACLDY